MLTVGCLLSLYLPVMMIPSGSNTNSLKKEREGLTSFFGSMKQPCQVLFSPLKSETSCQSPLYRLNHVESQSVWTHFGTAMDITLKRGHPQIPDAFEQLHFPS